MATVVTVRARPVALAPVKERRVKSRIEQEPEFALFMHHLLEDALAHPDRLTPAAAAFRSLHELLAGVQPDL